MATRQIALVSEAKELINNDALEHIALALKVQLQNDFEPAWEETAVLKVYDKVDDVPEESWRILIRESQEDAGFHCGRDGIPFAVVSTRRDLSETCKTCSHEVLEMLIDPTGEATRTAARIIGDGSERVNYLLEVCDPCQDADYAVEGLVVSDFVLPAYYEDRIAVPGVKYSHKENLKGPLEVLPGGYLSWQDPSDKRWQMALRVNGLQLVPLPGSPVDNTCPGLPTRRWMDLQSHRIVSECVGKLSDACREDYRQQLSKFRCDRTQIYNVCMSAEKR
jgi:hypothetical protein